MIASTVLILIRNFLTAAIRFSLQIHPPSTYYYITIIQAPKTAFANTRSHVVFETFLIRVALGPYKPSAPKSIRDLKCTRQ